MVIRQSLQIWLGKEHTPFTESSTQGLTIKTRTFPDPVK